MKRSFYYQDDKSNKYWAIEWLGNTCTSSNGRVGATPRLTPKTFATEAEAEKFFNQQIASKLKSGYIEGEAPGWQQPDWANMPMNDENFWRIIALFNWKKTGDDDAVMQPAVLALQQMSKTAIAEFEDCLAQKLYMLDTQAHAREIGENAYHDDENHHFSVDWFLYERCCVVANGKAFYDQVLADPKLMPKDMEFESLLYLAPNAYEQKTGKELDRITSVSYETYSNKAGWGKN